MKTFFYKCSYSGRNESTPQTQNNVSQISSKAELSFRNVSLGKWVESGPKIDLATGVMTQPNLAKARSFSNLRVFIKE